MLLQCNSCSLKTKVYFCSQCSWQFVIISTVHTDCPCITQNLCLHGLVHIDCACAKLSLQWCTNPVVVARIHSAWHIHSSMCTTRAHVHVHISILRSLVGLSHSHPQLRTVPECYMHLIFNNDRLSVFLASLICKVEQYQHSESFLYQSKKNIRILNKSYPQLNHFRNVSDRYSQTLSTRSTIWATVILTKVWYQHSLWLLSCGKMRYRTC